jgi:hypothetical protein
MKTQKIIAAIIIGVLIISSVEFTMAQSKNNKTHFRYEINHIKEYAFKASKIGKSKAKHVRKGNLNEFSGDHKITLENWMLNPEIWAASAITNSEDEKIELADWMLNPEIMGNKMKESIESSDIVIVLEDWMLSPEMMMSNSKKNDSVDEKIELAQWMLSPADFMKIK